MAKRGRHRKGNGKRSGGRTTPKGTRPLGSTPPAAAPSWPIEDVLPPMGSRPPLVGVDTPLGGSRQTPSIGDAAIDEIIDDLAAVLAEPHPIEFLSYASTFADVFDARSSNRLSSAMGGDGDDDLPNMAELLESSAATQTLEIAALGHAMQYLAVDEGSRGLAQRRLGSVPSGAPAWMVGLGDVEVTAGRSWSDECGEMENLLLGATIAGFPCSVLMLVDHNNARAAKDGYVIDGSSESTVALVRNLSAEERLSPNSFDEIPAGDVAARMVDAIDMGSRMWPPFESEEWPHARPLIEWILRHAPTGGVGYDTPELSEAAEEALIDEFLASPEGAAFAASDEDRQLMRPVLWYGAGYGTCDPLRWGPARAELFLLDWLPRKIIDSAEALGRFLPLVRAYIPWAHRMSGVSDASTAEVLDHISDVEPDFFEAISNGPGAGLEDVGPSTSPSARDDEADAPEPQFGQLRLLPDPAPDEGGLDGFDAGDDPFDDSAADARQAMSSPETFLHYASLTAALFDDRLSIQDRVVELLGDELDLTDDEVDARSRGDSDAGAAVDGQFAWFVDNSASSGYPELVAVVEALSVLATTPEQRAYAGRWSVANAPIPHWIRALKSAVIVASARYGDNAGEFEDLIVGFEVNHQQMTAVLRTDLVPGLAVNDAFVLPESFDEVTLSLLDQLDAQHPRVCSYNELDHGEARRRISEAIEADDLSGARSWPGPDADDLDEEFSGLWPSGLPLFEWLGRLLDTAERDAAESDAARSGIGADASAAVDVNDDTRGGRNATRGSSGLSISADRSMDDRFAEVLLDDLLIHPREMMAAFQRSLAEAAVGPDYVDDIPLEPLPPSYFDLDPLAVELREPVGAVTVLIDDCCAALLDDELRTASHRFLAVLVDQAPELFRRGARADIFSSAVLCLVGSANGLFTGDSVPEGRSDAVTQKAICEFLGTKQQSVANRGTKLLEAAGLPPKDGYWLNLGTPELLTSTYRRALAESLGQLPPQ